MTPEEDELFRRRRQARSVVMAVLLGALVVLIFAITLSRIRLAMT